MKTAKKKKKRKKKRMKRQREKEKKNKAPKYTAFERIIKRLSSDQVLYKGYKEVFLKSHESRESVAREFISNEFADIGEILEEIQEQDVSPLYKWIPYYTFMTRALTYASSGLDLPEVYKGHKPIDDFISRLKNALYPNGKAPYEI